jgi:hypothetical protein
MQVVFRGSVEENQALLIGEPHFRVILAGVLEIGNDALFPRRPIGLSVRCGESQEVAVLA